MIQDRASLLWVINLGCIDLNQWYARCDDVDRPDYLHFDLDPGVGATFDRVRETALVVRDALEALKMPSLVKTTGSKGLHVYVPIVRGPAQKQVWTFAKALAQELAARHPALITAEYRVAKRPRGRVLVDYNQNAWGRTLASIYSVRPRPEATVSTPVTWKRDRARHPDRGLHRGNVPARVAKLGDLWKPLLAGAGRFDLGTISCRSAASQDRLIAEQLADALEILDVIADRLDDHQHRHREQHAPDFPDPAPEEQTDEIATAFIRAARLVSQGVSRKPSSVVITSATPATSGRHAERPELQERDDGGAAGDDDRPEVGNRVEDAGEQAPDARPARGRASRNASHVATPTDRAGRRAARRGTFRSAGRSPRGSAP